MAGHQIQQSMGSWRVCPNWPSKCQVLPSHQGKYHHSFISTVLSTPQLIVSSPASSAETVELEDKELTIVSANDSQRQLALSRYNDWVNSTSRHSKSKSPRGSKRDRNTEQLPSPPRSPRRESAPEEPDTVPPLARLPFTPEHSYKVSTASSPYPAGSSSLTMVSRRPHTSAGPRDWSSRRDARNYDGLENRSNRLAVPPRAETAHPTRFSRTPLSSRGFFRQKSVEVLRLGSSSSTSRAGHSSVESSQHCTNGSLLFETVNVVDVQAWEQELARIESASRRNSADMLGFLSQRKKANVEHPSIPTYLHAEG